MSRFSRWFWVKLYRYVGYESPEQQIDYPKQFSDWLEERNTFLNGE